MNPVHNRSFSKLLISEARKILLLLSFTLLSFLKLSAQPDWIPGTPSVVSTGPITITLNYGINSTGTVYIVIYSFDPGVLSSALVRAESYQFVPNGGRMANAVVPIPIGSVNNALQTELIVYNPNSTFYIYLVAENSGGILQTTPTKLIATTLPCPKIDILTGFSQGQLCVNKGATAVFQTVLIDPATSGILKGTQWFLDWGDGTTVTYTSTADNNLPSLALRTHTYTSVTNCNYVFSNTIRNPCGETRSVQYVAVVHGRDIPSDGNGVLRIVNNANGSSVIQVCEGTQSVITLRDNSTWNCQNPVLPGGLTAIPNTDPRNIEWLYGRDPSGAIFNTINGTVNIATLGDAPRTSGRIVPSPYGSSSQSQAITIPATARAGEYFRVYLKNWNKCNWTDPEYVSTYVDIFVVSAPLPPTVPDKTICLGGNRTLSVSSTPVGTITWYSSAALTTVLGTGLTYVPTQTAVGNYSFWVTDRSTTGLQCRSAATMVTLTINPIPLKPSLSHPAKNDICYDGGLTTYTITAVPATPPAITSYQWYKDGVALPGEVNSTIILSQPSHTGSYTVSTIGVGSSFCPSPQSDPWYVTVHTLSNLTNPVPVTICQNQTATFSAFTTDEVQNWQWEVSTNGGATFSTVANGPPYNGFKTNTLTITTPPPSFNGYLYRVEIKTPPGQGGCPFKSASAMLTVDGLPSATAGSPIQRCTLTPTDPILMTGSTAGGTYTSAVWTGGAGYGTWTQNNNPALAYFTPSVNSATFTATLTVTGTAACAGVNATGTRVISWSQTPSAEAGPNISRCDASPLAAIVMNGATAGGSYSAATWSGGSGLGTWSQNINPALATFTPTSASGSFTATLTVTGMDGCTGNNPTDTRLITWGQTPVSEAGPDINRCDVNPTANIAMTGSSATGTYTNAVWTGGGGLGTWTQNINPALATFKPTVTSGSFPATLSLTGTGACAGSNPTDIRTVSWSYEATVNAGPDQGICALADVKLAGSMGGSATSVTWTGGAGTFTPNNTTLDAVYSPTGTERGNHTVTLTLTTNEPPGICPVASDQVTISIGTLPTSAVIATSGDACFNVAPSWLNLNVNGGGEPYTVKYTINGTGFPDITNYLNNTNYNLGVLPVGSYTYRITEIRDNCGSILTGPGLPGPVTINIYQNPVANAGSDQLLCTFLSANLAAIPSVGIGTWSVVSGPGTATFSPNANSPTATISVTDYGSYILRWTEVNGGICTSSADKSILFEKSATAGPAQNLCGTLSATLAGNTPAVGTGTWSLVSGPGTVSFTPGANFPGAAANVSAYGAYVFRWTISNSGFCSTSSTVPIEYIPAGQVNKPSNLVVCNGTVTAPVSFTTSNPGGTTTYSWTNDNTSIGLAALGNGNLPSFTAGNTGTAPVTATITITPTYSNGIISCPGPSETFTITVNPAGHVDQPVNRIVCENSTVDVSFTTLNTGTTIFNWTNSNPAIGLPASGSGDISFIAFNAATSPITGTITVTPVYQNGGTNCPGPQKSFNITINPEGQINIPANMSVCNGSSTTVTFATANTGGVTSYTWVNNNTAIGLGTNGAGSSFTFVAANTGIIPISGTITVTPTFSNGLVDCPGPSQSFNITVNPTPALSSPLTLPDICSKTAVTYTPNGTIAGTNFSWTRGATAGISPSGPTIGNGDINEVLRNLTNIPIGVTYQYTLTANGCSNIQNVSINIKPEPVIAAGQTANICSNNSVSYSINLVNFSNPGDLVTFTWPAPVLNPSSPLFTGGTDRTSASGLNLSDTFINKTGSTGTATYTVTPYKNGCAGTPETITVFVRSEPILDPGLNRTVCSNTATGLILGVAPGSVSADYYIISNVTMDDGLSAVPGNAPISSLISAPAGYLSNDKYINITGVDKNVTYRIQPFRGPDCFGTPVDVVVTIHPQPYIVPAQIKSVCSGVAIGKEILLSPANIPAGTRFSWPVPDMSDASGQGTAAANMAADPAGKLHINDIINNTSGIPITATYYVTPVSTDGCTGTTIPVIITINPEPSPRIISGRDKVCVNEINLVYSVTPSPSSTFHWNVDPAVGAATFDFNTNAIIVTAASVAGSGNITVYETNSYTCNGDPSSLPVRVYTKPVPENISGPANVCAFSTRTYSVTARAGSVYAWSIPGGAAIIGDPSAASVTVVFGNVGGAVNVSETNIAGCVTVHNPVVVTVRPLPSAVISGGGTICQGTSQPLNIDFSGTGPYTFTYAINGVSQTPVSTSADPYTLNATQAGVYTIVNVSDATGCTNTGSGSAIVSYFVRPTGTISGGAELCRGASTILTMVFTGTPPFTFTYSDGTTQLTVPNHLNAVYTLSVSPALTSTYTLISLTDGNNCSGSVSGSAVVTVNQPPVLAITGINLTCNSNNTGIVNMTVTGNGPFGVAWTGPSGYTSNSEDLTGLRAGTYNVTVTDTKGCISTGSVTLTEPAALNAQLASTDIYCFGSAEGTITISLPSGGSGIYEYSINGGTNWGSSGSFTGLNPGTFDVRIRDVMNPVCFRVLNGALILTGPARLNATVTSTGIDCFGANNGSIIISNPTGGFGTYEFSIDGGGTWQGSGNFTNLGPGGHDVRMRDVLHITCGVILNPNVSIAQPPQLSAILASTNISCFGSTDGSITISSPMGGHGTYQFSINGGGSWQASGSFPNLTPGTYNVQIRDAAFPGCFRILDGMRTLTQPPVLRASLASTMVTCNGAKDGTISITGASGGYGTYQYTINGGTDWFPAGLFTGLTPGSYDVRIRDAAHIACEIILNNGLDITQPDVLSATVVKTDITCFGARDGRITITNSQGGYGTYEYSIDGGGAWQTSNVFPGLLRATYNVQMRDRVRTNCVLILNNALVINEPAALAASLASTNITCYDANNGTITISSPTGGLGTYQYTVNGGASWQGTGNFINLSPGPYDVRIRDAVNTGCYLVLNPNLVLTQPGALTATLASSNITCFGAADGTITISAPSGGSGSFEYTINGGTNWQLSGNYTGLGPSNYNVRIRDANQKTCIIILNSALSITQPVRLSAVVTPTMISCFGARDGIININNPSGGYGTYEYSISGGTSWFASGLFTALDPGFYNVRIRDAANRSCEIILNSSLEITQPSVLNASVTSTNITCFNANDGTIIISLPTGGYGTFEYTIDGGLTWVTSGNFTGLGIGTYNVQIRDRAHTGCVRILNSALVITQPVILNGTVASTNVNCNGTNNGTITISSPSGGYGTYQYSIDGGVIWQSSGAFTGLAPGSYNVRMRDAANITCFRILSPALSITQPAALAASVTSVNVTCFGGSNGRITISGAAGGSGTYEFTVNGGTTWQSSGIFTGLIPGFYNVQMRDALYNGCIRVLNGSLSITQPSMLYASVTPTMVTCNGLNNGIISITSPSGGYGTYQYSIDGGANWSGPGLFTGLRPLVYNVQIRDAANPSCLVILNNALAITEPAVLNATVSSTNITCNGSRDGTINISFPIGGYGTYEYSIDGGFSWQTTGYYTGLSPATYVVEIRDRANIACVRVLNTGLILTQPTALSATVASANVTCNSANNGTITISNPLGGYGTYAYSVNGGSSWQVSPAFGNLAPGIYNVVMRDAANPACVAILNSNLTITQPSVLSASVASTNVTCYGSTDATITITGAAGGYGTYEYTVTGGTTWQGSGIFAGLAPGFYNVQIRDAANRSCIVVLNSSLRITEPSLLAATVSKTDITCFGSNNGTITISSPTGGYGTYEYSINGGTNWFSSPGFTGLSAGSYNIRMRDAANRTCTVILNSSLSIIEPGLLRATVTPTMVSCFGASNGIISITSPSGGSGTYLYSVSGGTSWQGSGTFNNLAPGNYNVWIRDAANLGCVIILNSSLAITQPPVLRANVAGTNVSCFGGNNGTITISSPTGGYGTYQFTINGGGSWQTSGTFTGLTPGSYNILIRDAANTGCIIILNNSFVITQPGLLSASISKTEVTCNGNHDGTITITNPSGGYGTYDYSIDGGSNWQGNGSFTNLAPDVYDVRLRDRANIACSVILYPNLIISEPLPLSISTTGNVVLDCSGDKDGMGTFFASGGTMPYIFSVVSDNTGGTVAGQGFNSLTFFNAGAGTITARVVDFNGCAAQTSIVLTQPAPLTSGIISSDQVICFGASPATLNQVSAPSGGPGSYIYQWQSSPNIAGPFMNISLANSNTYTPPPAASYTIYYRRMVTSGVCTPVYSNIVEVRVNPLPMAILTGGETICPGQSSNLRVTLPAGTGPFRLNIENLGTVLNYTSGNNIVVTPAATTTYRLLGVRDANNCEVLSPSANLNGIATVIVSTLPSINSFTPSPPVCEFTLAKFNIAAAGTNLTYQWYVSTNGGSSFAPVSDGGTYFGSLTPELQIFSTARSMNGYIYHVVVSGCGNSVTSPDAVLTVNTPPEITQIPRDTTICLGQSAIMRVNAAGTMVSYQWFINKGAGFFQAVDDSFISGSNTRTLTITNAQASFNNWIFRATATGNCGVPVGTSLAVLRVINPPSVTQQPVSRTICENGATSFMANGTGYISMQWQVLSGGTWTALTDNSIYVGTSTQALFIMSASAAMNGNRYRLALTGGCITVSSDPGVLTVNSNPVVDFSAVDPISACGGVPIVLNGNPSGGSGTYTQHRWTGDIGPLNNYFIQSPVFNSSIPDSYNLNYRVTDSNGCTNSDDVTVSLDSPSAMFSQDITYGCTPLQVNFTKDMTGISKWWWNFDDGSPVDSVNANPVHNFINSVPGSIEYYDVMLRVRSVSGCLNEFTSTITVYPSVEATFTPDNDTVCSGNVIVFTAVPGASRYFWNYGDGVSGYSTNAANHLYTNMTTAPVIRSVQLTTTSFFGCMDVSTYNITVMPVPVPQFTANPVTQAFNPAGTPVTFTNLTNTGTWTWLWKFGDNSTSTDMNPVHSYNDVGTYYITLIAGNASCSDSIMHYVSIVPPAPVASFDSIPSGCAPLYVVFNNTSLNTEVPGTTYKWDFGDGSTSTAKNPTYTYFTPDNYRVELTVTGPGGTSVMSRVVSAYPSPKAYFEVLPRQVYVNDENVRCFNLTQGAVSYLWDFGDGDTSSVKEPVHRYMDEGEYDITLWAYSANGCSDMYILSPAVTVLPVGELRFPNVFTPNKTGPIERTDLPTSGIEVDQFFYPPVREKVITYNLQIFNRWGVLIFESHDINIPWNGYYQGKLCPQGVYVWLVEGKFSDGRPYKMAGNVTVLH